MSKSESGAAEYGYNAYGGPGTFDSTFRSALTWDVDRDVLEAIVQGSACIGIYLTDGTTPFDHAIMERDESLLSFLLAHHADLNIGALGEKGPLLLAVEVQRPDMVRCQP